MRIAIIADVHANLAALEAITESYDLLLCLGDLVDYGPQPREAIRWVREHGFKVVRGNHDQALGCDMDCRCAPLMKEASVTTRAWHRQLLEEDDRSYLRQLPVREWCDFGGVTFVLAHASPTGDLYTYLRPEISDEVLAQESQGISADFIFLGHTHLPMMRRIGKTTIVNPGSIGQPRHGDPQASYVIWDDGNVYFRRVTYDAKRTIEMLAHAPLSQPVIAQLTHILRTGGATRY
ncbi:MAG TPA: metallophosphoesterase family protein [Chthonomonadales bacterium]|nr:metallophosphoesterase family protein [Chthonomonadales bacterium]